jgi:transcriptional regulator with XRE-family HTH domain
MKKPKDISVKFARLILEKRTGLGLSHEQLAVKAGLDRSTVSLYESGKRVPSITSAMRIAAALDMRLSDMIAELEG